MASRPLLWRGIVVGAMVLAGVGLLVLEARGLVADRQERRGRVTVSGCTFKAYAQHRNVYSCHGSFSDGGDLSVPDVDFDNVGDLDAGAVVTATVSGPEDTTAHLVSESHWRLVLTIGGALVLFGCAISLARAPVVGRRPGPPDAGTP